MSASILFSLVSNRSHSSLECTANSAPGLMKGIAEILQRLAAMDNRLGEIDNRLAGVNAMSFNHPDHRAQFADTAHLPTAPKNRHGFHHAFALFEWGHAELIIFYNDDFGIVEDDDEAARRTKYSLSFCHAIDTSQVDTGQAAVQALPFSVLPLPPPPTPTTAKSLLIQRPLYKPKPKPRPTPGTGTAPPPRKRHARHNLPIHPPPPAFSFTPHAHVGGPALAPVLASAAKNCRTTIASKSNTRRPSPSPPSSPLSSPCLPPPPPPHLHRHRYRHHPASSALCGTTHRVPALVVIHASASLRSGHPGMPPIEDFPHPHPFSPSLRLRLRLRLRLTSPFTHTVLSLSINIHGMRNLPPTPAQPYSAPPTPPAPLPSAQPSTRPRRAQASLIAAATAARSSRRYRRRCRSRRRAPPAAHARPIKRINASSGATHEGCWWVGVRLTTAGERDEDVPVGPQRKRDKGVALACLRLRLRGWPRRQGQRCGWFGRRRSGGGEIQKQD
ncbi:hypothetical protein D9615_006658 [Tricholomella constricta]|uniref:Uncharacterized protein n=1 Tax=Tricholomella constricta TaxID=117010 RepID=A0A8H5H9V2_9AGAR|nr:hypothetical protein D9615_006658 [Tricholomella constricta]